MAVTHGVPDHGFGRGLSLLRVPHWPSPQQRNPTLPLRAAQIREGSLARMERMIGESEVVSLRQRWLEGLKKTRCIDR